MNYFITGIDTGVGKTVVSAIFTEMLGFDYWKPIQSGDLDNSDTMKVQELVARNDVAFYPEGFRLTHPLSPHASAKLDNISISPIDFSLPSTDKLLIEGAGGVMVPINEKGDCIVDLIDSFNCEAIVVSKHYLGSINHTVLTCSVLKQKGIPIRGIIFVGDENQPTETIIASLTKCQILGRIPWNEKVDSAFVKEQALQLQQTWKV